MVLLDWLIPSQVQRDIQSYGRRPKTIDTMLTKEQFGEKYKGGSMSPWGILSGTEKYYFDVPEEVTSWKSCDVIEYSDFPVQLNETYIFSFYVRTESDTASISIISKDHSASKERHERIWSNIGTDWKRIWIKKTFNYIDLDKEDQRPKAWVNIIGPKSIYIWGLQLEKADIEQEEPREYVSTDGNWSDIEVFLVPESPNWGWKSIKLLDNGDKL